MLVRIAMGAWACACMLTPSAALAERIVLIVGGAEKQIYLPVVLADRLGYFQDEQLDVSVESEVSGVSAADALLAGAAQGVAGAYDHTIDLQSKGKSVTAIVQFTISPGEVMLVSSRYASAIHSPANFEGHAVGVTGLGSSTSFLTQYLSLSSGVRPGGLRLVPIGSGNAFRDAMKSGRVHAGMTTEPTASSLVASGEAKVLVDLRTPEVTQKALGGIYPFTCLYVRTDWLAHHRVEAQKLANALVRALHYINNHSAGEVATVLPPSFLGGDRTTYVKSLALSKSMFTPDGVMPAGGPASVLRVLATVNRDLQKNPVDLKRTYTTEFVNAVR
jgi:NitT/TauT family transport system substrate-binding protein